MGCSEVWKHVRCYEGHHFRVRTSDSSGMSRFSMCLGQNIEHFNGPEEQWKKRQIEIDLAGKWTSAVLKALRFCWRGSETP